MSLDTRSGSFITNNGVSHLCVPFMTFAGTKLKPQKKPTQTNQICVRGNHRCSLNVNTVNYLASNQKKTVAPIQRIFSAIHEYDVCQRKFS